MQQQSIRRSHKRSHYIGFQKASSNSKQVKHCLKVCFLHKEADYLELSSLMVRGRGVLRRAKEGACRKDSRMSPVLGGSRCS